MNEVKLALFGHPVAHSLSPRIHAMFAAQTGVALEYKAFDVAPEQFADALRAFWHCGGCGANVTLPLKQLALASTESVSALAQKVGAANTLLRTATGWHADNTDVGGLLRDLTQRHGCAIGQRRVLLIGAGGAARAAAYALHGEHPSTLVIVNRDVGRADSLARDLGDPARAMSFSDLADQPAFDVIVHATSAGHASSGLNLPAHIAHAESVCYDLSYGQAAATFSRWAVGTDARRNIDGLGMLVEQAADAFALWHGVRPHTDAVLAELRVAFPSDKG